MSEIDDEQLHKPEGGNLTRRIANELGRAIVTEQFSAATPFPVEAELCRQFDASRPVVREALKMLTAKGLLRSRQRAGTVVEPEDSWNLLDPDVLRWMMERKFSVDLLIEFTEVLLSIAPRAASLAAHSATGPQRQQIVAAVDNMAAAHQDEGAALDAQIAFHTAILLASNNRFIRQFRELTGSTLRFSLRQHSEYAEVFRSSVGDCNRIAEAIIRGEPVKAGDLMRQLLQRALDQLASGSGTPG